LSGILLGIALWRVIIMRRILKAGLVTITRTSRSF
jgi:hypothetical protein